MKLFGLFRPLVYSEVILSELAIAKLHWLEAQDHLGEAQLRSTFYAEKIARLRSLLPIESEKNTKGEPNEKIT